MNKHRIAYTLKTLGVKPRYCGYAYLVDAIEMLLSGEEIKNNITKSIYPSVAKKNKTTSSKVERGIRHAIEVAFSERENSVWRFVFSCDIKNKPTNGEFIAAVTDYLLLQGGSEDEQGENC